MSYLEVVLKKLCPRWKTDVKPPFKGTKRHSLIFTRKTQVTFLDRRSQVIEWNDPFRTSNPLKLLITLGRRTQISDNSMTMSPRTMILLGQVCGRPLKSV
ncbi:hypothetical protein WA026_017521 [Henosepilachna vigintioctopunctata]|uniref:Uncharacterized protein n=1 Tax=Henosepilachna vigintioctopunctata TaxID=420089 RepID=A0AAW1UUT3_9CUCU